MEDNLRHEYGDKTILEFMNLWENGCLNLEPGFQRKSVWRLSDRQKLLESLLEGYPIPSIFLYKREESGYPVYDVIDGKQRLETIFMFTKAAQFKRDGFGLMFQFPDDERPYWYDWRELRKWNRTAPLLGRKIQTVEVTGDTSEIINLFVRINSTGKALTSAEKRHAKYNKSPFLAEAVKVAQRYRHFLLSNDIVRTGQIDRMKDVELVCELLASVASGTQINKKAAVDRAVGNLHINGNALRKNSSEVAATLNLIKRMFPAIQSTRFRNISEFYTLFMVVWEMSHQKLVLTDKRRNRIAQELLIKFSVGVDSVRDMQVHLRTGKKVPRLYAEYLLTVQQSTDALPQRRRRAEIVRGVISGIFERKDTKRVFSAEQRRILWNTDERPKCSVCHQVLTWNNFQVDHRKAYARGGRTSLSNAALICAHCNASKGAKTKR
ncbi:MAG: DUF262 domain-containing protein [Candidatus Hydrogenedentes bacterium]|nr:DUF262 domain-containing protein [Candidatus Hydrogenedentota bacterium]